jgi:hypothetical protein
MIQWFKRSFEKDGNPDAARITAFMAFCVIVILAGIDQLSKYKINDMVFLTFAGICTAGLGIAAFFKK